jgi:BMFP domain-containing protein YqiC
MEQLNKLDASQEKTNAVKQELKTVISAMSSELKSDVSAVSSEMKSGINVVSSDLKKGYKSVLSNDLKTDVCTFQEKVSAIQEKHKKDIQNEVTAIKYSQHEFEGKVADKLEKQLKGVTLMTEQYTWNLHEDLNWNIESTRQDVEAKLRQVETTM